MNNKKYDSINLVIKKYVLDAHIDNPSILDIGCWQGNLGKALISTIQCQVDGIDIAANALETAKNNGYRHIYLKDLNNFNADLIFEKYDIIILGDILEHLLYPEKIIHQLHKLLNKNGKVIISLPNIAFIYYRLSHLFGLWEYKETGVMDKTHLHFYTLSSMNEMFLRNRLKLIRHEGFIGIKNWPFFIRFILSKLSKIWPQMFAIQIVFLLEFN
ncbi:class I SAM-dependent methyltransferase [Candidatus Venteria ishoeyi]|uniref:Bifunctional 3-demethylubiquinone-9 3-methyltransferase/ 2-octaprenyl-6-hydroxy phenol methylase n=1 Tax=Candidatus Venteria ishoeyi TaxID=1899563 RepID=A0A1H6FAK6_9GAMM|nr:class I SAM-dependent methyltransferase [Candidatus Venteria ishoeyi]SEH07140.1 bifunctional 3-demethylubiquinone-9 3-methyltransferase/ 2-octaprenyl-6-hydroxy phenol methylase [Candidatus Venteria ishoeyi]